MRKMLCLLAAFFLAGTGISAQAESVVLTNADFEAGVTIALEGFDADPDIPGWFDGNVFDYADVAFETFWWGGATYNNSYSANMQHGYSAYLLSTNTVTEADEMTVRFAGLSYGGESELTAILFYGGDTNNVIGTYAAAVTDTDWGMYENADPIIVPPEADGQTVGVMIEVSGSREAAFDEVSVEVQAPQFLSVVTLPVGSVEGTNQTLDVLVTESASIVDTNATLLYLDGADVSTDITFEKAGSLTTISYDAIGLNTGVHTAKVVVVGVPDLGPVTNEWNFSTYTAGVSRVTFGTEVPPVGDGVQNLAFSTSGTADDSAGDNTSHPYVANDYIMGNPPGGLNLGQSFTTGSNPAGYSLSSISVRQVSWGPTDWDYDGGNVTLRVFTLDGDTNGVLNGVDILMETVAVSGTNSATLEGTPGANAQWLTFSLGAPVELAADAQYGFVVSSDGDANNGGIFMEWDGRNDDPFDGGQSLTIPGEESGFWAGGSTSDRSFVAGMEIITELPEFYPIVLTPADDAVGVINPVELTAEIVDWGDTFSSAIMLLDGFPVVPLAYDTVGDTTTVTYDAGNLAADSVHSVNIIAYGAEGSASASASFTMAPSLTFVSSAPLGGGIATNPTLEAVIASGASQVDTGNMALYLDGILVTNDQINVDTPTAGNVQILGYAEGLESGTTHTAKVVYAGSSPAAGPFTNSWTFITVGDPGYGIYIYTNSLPAIGADDISQLLFSTNDATNVQNGDDNSTYVANDRPAQGQTFTTASDAAAYQLTAVWVKHAPYSQWFDGLAENALSTIRVTDPSQAGTAGFVQLDAALAVVTNTGGAMTDGFHDAGSDGNWVEYRLQSPVILDPSKRYGFDVAASGGTENDYWELAGTNDSTAYPDGSAYTSGAMGVGDSNMTETTGSHTFILKLTAIGGVPAGPAVSAAVSSGSLVLSWDSGSYNVLTNADLVNGTWGVAVSNAVSPVTNLISSDSELFFKLESNE